MRATTSEQADGSALTPKRRGRPRTTSKAPPPQGDAPATPKRRGRPKTRDVDAPATPATPSRRGRKPKTASEPADDPAQRSIAAAVADMDAAVRGQAPEAATLATRQDAAPAPNRDMYVLTGDVSSKRAIAVVYDTST